MAKCDKCGEEYPDDSEHVCAAEPEETKTEEETDTSAE